jgi:predicted dehydrogenase
MDLKVSVIGSGRWGKNLVSKFHTLGVLHLVYGHQNREMLQERCNARFTEDIDRLIDESDAVVVAAPPAVHYELSRKVMEAGKDLFVEKPIALSVEEAVELARLADAEGQVMLVGHILCYGPGFDALNSLPGEPVEAEGCFLKTSTPEKFLNAYWNFGVHMIALGVALGVPEERMCLEADDKAPVNRRTFTLRTREEDGTEHELTWDFLDPKNQSDILMTECQHFLECVRSREKPRTDGWHAVEVMRRLVKVSPDYRKEG